MRETLKDFCLKHNREDILQQWHITKNGDLTPDDISYGSKQPVWWHCDKNHDWQSPPYYRTSNFNGCPYCSGTRVAPGRDLQSRYPDLAAQWHPLKNGNSTPDQITPGSHKKVWWRCDQGHEWLAPIQRRVLGSNCPVCTGKSIVVGDNDLNAVSPLIAKQWHPTKNGTLSPTDVTAGSKKKVWWRCEKGHDWQATIHSRTYGTDCPICAGKMVAPGINDLATRNPTLASQWCSEKNGQLTPQDVTEYSNKSVWWRCEKDHEWKCQIKHRSFMGSGCPYCSNRRVISGYNDLRSLYPKVAAQWHPTLNAPLEPDQVPPGSKKRVWWQCPLGHEWKAVIYSRTGSQSCGCPECAGRPPRKYK